MRAGFDGLAAKVQQIIGADPFSGHVFIFRSKRGHYLKGLYWDGSGLCLFAKRLERGRFVWPPLVDGIQNLQFDYGIDTDGDGAPDYSTTGTNNNAGVALTHTDWAQVMTVRANVLVRTTEPSAGQNDQKTYNLGLAGDVGPFGDRYKRHVFTELVRVVNPSGRKAS